MTDYYYYYYYYCYYYHQPHQCGARSPSTIENGSQRVSLATCCMWSLCKLASVHAAPRISYCP